MINNDFTIQFKNRFYQLVELQPTTVRARDKILVEEWLDETLHFFLREKYLSFTVLPERPVFYGEGRPDPQRQTKDFVEIHGGFIKRRKKKHAGKAIPKRRSSTETAQQTALQTKKRLEKCEEKEAFLENTFHEEEMEQMKEENDLSNFDIKEYGITESILTPEQLSLLYKIRAFVQKTSKTYQTAMHELMRTYQSHNPQFTDTIKQKMMERGYDLPQFSIYSAGAARQFLSEQQKLGNVSFDENSFLVKFFHYQKTFISPGVLEDKEEILENSLS